MLLDNQLAYLLLEESVSFFAIGIGTLIKHKDDLVDDLDCLLRGLFQLTHAIDKLSAHHEVAALLGQEDLGEDRWRFLSPSQDSLVVLHDLLIWVEMDHAEVECFVSVLLLMTRLLMERLVYQRDRLHVVVQPLIIDEISQALNIVGIVLDKHDVRLGSLMILPSLLRQLDLNEPVLVLLCLWQLFPSIQQVHLLLFAKVHIAGKQLLDVFEYTKRLDVEDLLEHVEEEHGRSVHKQEYLLLNVLGLPHMQFLKVEGILLGLLTYLILLKEE